MWIDDIVLKECTEPLTVKIWVPEKPIVVLGRSNDADREVNVEVCRRDAVDVYKRIGGGGTVLLHSGCLVVSVGCWVREFYHNDRYFRLLNQAIISCIESRETELKLSQKGYSDIVLNDRKIAGTSLFRSRNYLLYQASILIDLKIETIEKYLQHPSLEPEYRQGRSHRDFLMGLNEVADGGPQQWLDRFNKIFLEKLSLTLADEKIASQPAQVPHILNRVSSD